MVELEPVGKWLALADHHHLFESLKMLSILSKILGMLKKYIQQDHRPDPVNNVNAPPPPTLQHKTHLAAASTLTHE